MGQQEYNLAEESVEELMSRPEAIDLELMRTLADLLSAYWDPTTFDEKLLLLNDQNSLNQPQNTVYKY